MHSGRIAVLAAGLLEIAWAHSIRLTDGFTKLVPTLVCGTLALALIIGGVILLNLADRTPAPFVT